MFRRLVGQLLQCSSVLFVCRGKLGTRSHGLGLNVEAKTRVEELIGWALDRGQSASAGLERRLL